MSMKRPRAARPLIHDLYERPMSGEAIEARSLEIIDQEAEKNGFSQGEWTVVRRMVHTTADFDLIPNVRFSPDAVQSGIRALRSGAPLYVDSNMIRSGLSMARLRRVNPAYGPDLVFSHVADEDISAQAGATGLPRSLFAVRKAVGMLDGAVAVFGNAPVALLELNRMIMENEVKPALVIGMPVGFVHVVESKKELMSLACDYIVVAGRRGGSPLAVSVIHALCGLAENSG
ncbi:MAG: precorrin-8X methylmutase [Pseudomonadota bacterium]